MTDETPILDPEEPAVPANEDPAPVDGPSAEPEPEAPPDTGERQPQAPSPVEDDDGEP